MHARRIIAAGILAVLAAGCGVASPTLADLGDPPAIPFAPPTDTAGFVPEDPERLP
jgi:hypothetical protein